MDEVLALIGRAHQGDKEARDTLVEKNTGLVHSIVKRFLNRGVEMEDLFQIGTIGLLKAIDKFDCSFDVKFSTYAVPMITGEIKRYLRDQGMIKVSRSLKEINAKAYRVHEALFAESGREPGLEEIAEKIAVTREELVMAMEAGAQIDPAEDDYQGDGSGIVLEDKIEAPENRQESLLNKMLLEQLLGSLEAKERELIYLRFFQEKTQMQIAGELGISQVQVSRMEKKILKVLRERID